MKTIHVYDPPMCCSTGVCGPEVDPILAAFAGFLQQAKELGWSVERYNLTQQPIAFVENDIVKGALEKEGAEVLPLIFLDGDLVLKGSYPNEDQRSAWLKDDIVST